MKGRMKSSFFAYASARQTISRWAATFLAIYLCLLGTRIRADAPSYHRQTVPSMSPSPASTTVPLFAIGSIIPLGRHVTPVLLAKRHGIIEYMMGMPGTVRLGGCYGHGKLRQTGGGARVSSKPAAPLFARSGRTEAKEQRGSCTGRTMMRMMMKMTMRMTM